MSAAAPTRHAVAQMLHRRYGLVPDAVRLGPAGTDTVNYLAGADNATVFVKVYPSGADLAAERAALAVSQFAADHGVPTAPLRRTLDGAELCVCGSTALSVWDYLPTQVDVDAGLCPAQLAAVGEMVGRLHRATATYPGLPALVRAGVEPSIDVAAQPDRWHHLATLIDAAADLAPAERDWLRRCHDHRVAVWRRVRDLTAELPPLTHQVGHGDLAAVNVLWPVEEAPVLIDFRPPRRVPMLYDLTRIALDPRTIVARTDWFDGLLACVAGYRRAHPGARADDLRSAARFWLGYTTYSTYPLAALARSGRPGAAPAPAQLWRYGRARQQALQTVLARLPALDAALADLARKPDASEA